MKKGILALIIILALVVLVSPGIVGHMAESSMDDQIDWATSETPEIVVTTEYFDRGWFSSEGVHRVEISQTGAGASIRDALGISPGDPGPALIVNTTLDHGLIPVTSVTREEGSLMPGLGRAVSTMSVEVPGDETFDVPGVVYTSVDLGGGMSSNYYLEAGSYDSIQWGAADVRIDTDSSGGTFTMVGGMDSLTIADPDGGGTVEMSMLEIDADSEMTDYGFTTGDLAFSLQSVDIAEGFQTISMGPINIEAGTELNGDRVDSDMQMDMAFAGSPLGDISYEVDLALEDVDADAFGRVLNAIEAAQGNPDPMMAFASMERDVADLVAGGLTFRIDQLDVSLPQGTMLAQLEIEVPETDASSFAWPTVLLAMEASADVTIPAGLFDMMAAMNPQVNAAVAAGFLRPDGDNYVMEAQYKQGLLTVNGAPMPIPIPGM